MSVETVPLLRHRSSSGVLSEIRLQHISFPWFNSSPQPTFFFIVIGRVLRRGGMWKEAQFEKACSFFFPQQHFPTNIAVVQQNRSTVWKTVVQISFIYVACVGFLMPIPFRFFSSSVTHFVATCRNKRALTSRCAFVQSFPNRAIYPSHTLKLHPLVQRVK